MTTIVSVVLRDAVERHRSAIVEHRRVVDAAHGHGRVVIGAGTAVPIGQHKPHSTCPGCRGIGIGILVGDVLDERRHRRGSGTAVQRNDEVAAAVTPRERADGGAAVGNVRSAHADLACTGALIANAQHILGAVTPRREAHSQSTGIQVGTIDISDHRIAALLDHHRPVAFTVR